MQNNFLKTLPLAFLTTSMVVSGLTACSSSDDSIAEEPTPVVNPTQTNVHQVRIHATMGGDAQTRAVSFDGTTSNSTFQTTEAVYVYNATKNTMLGGILDPTDISDDGKSCDLTGELTGTIETNDELRLFYNLNRFTPSGDALVNYFNYNRQTGAASTVLDGAEATVTVSDYADGTLTTAATASFLNVQSMFRQSLTFKNANGETVTPTITSLKVSSRGGNLIMYYRPLASGDDVNISDALLIENPVFNDGDIYLSLRFVNSDANDALTFTAQDSDGNIYECTKNAPSGGFQNGKYYHGSMTLTYARKLGMPEVSGTDVQPNSYNRYDIANPNDITISGTSVDYRFEFSNAGTITFDNLTASHTNNRFIYSSKDLTVNISGENNITCNYPQCIYVGGNLKLTGNGTLTVTATSDYTRCGIMGGGNYSYNNNQNSKTSELDVTSQLALDPEKTTVVRSARTSNSDGTYTWTYTVTTAE